MNRKVLKVYEEWPIFVSINEVNGRIRQLVRVVVTLICGQRLVILRAEGVIIGSDPSRDGFIETVSQWILVQMSLAEVRRGIAMFV